MSHADQTGAPRHKPDRNAWINISYPKDGTSAEDPHDIDWQCRIAASGTFTATSGEFLTSIHAMINRSGAAIPSSVTSGMTRGEFSGNEWWFSGSNKVPGAINGDDNRLDVVGVYGDGSGVAHDDDNQPFFGSGPAWCSGSGRQCQPPSGSASAPCPQPEAICDNFPVVWTLAYLEVAQKKPAKPRFKAEEKDLALDRRTSTPGCYVWKSKRFKTADATVANWFLRVQRYGRRYVAALEMWVTAKDGLQRPTRVWENSNFHPESHNVLVMKDGRCGDRAFSVVVLPALATDDGGGGGDGGEGVDQERGDAK